MPTAIGSSGQSIPADRAAIGVFSTLDDMANKNTAALIQESAKSNAPAESEARKIADLYNSYMDESAIETKGLTPLHSQLAAIAAIKTKRDLAARWVRALRADVDPLNNTNFHTVNLFGLWVAPGFHDPEHYHPYLLQGGIELPDREYYLGDSARMKEIQTKYQTHVAAMFRLAGFDDADARATRVIALENAIAETHEAWPMMKIFTKRTTPGSARISPRRLRVWIGQNISVVQSSPIRTVLLSGSRVRSPVKRRWWHRPQWIPGKTGLGIT